MQRYHFTVTRSSRPCQRRSNAGNHDFQGFDISRTVQSACHAGCFPICYHTVGQKEEFVLAGSAHTLIELECKACGSANPSAALFCSRCTAPLNVVALGELTDADRRVCLASLFSVLAETLSRESIEPATTWDRELWAAYLSAFWLRPETALILYAEALAIRNAVPTPGKNWLDLGCGDGVHAALYSGWRFDPIFDVFQSLDLSAADIYHYWNANDFQAPFAARGTKIDFGIDIKPTAIQRATALNVFSDVQQADATRLPLVDRSVQTIFSNMLRDLGDPLSKALAECRRVLTDDGTLLISAMTPAYSRHLHFAPAARRAEAEGDSQRARDLLRLDRGRSVFCQRQLSVSAWQSVLNEQGLTVRSVHPIVGPAIIRFWDIGLRPFSIPLLKQRESWKNSNVLAAVKPGMLEMLSAALEPLLQNLTADEPCMNLIVAGKA